MSKFSRVQDGVYQVLTDILKQERDAVKAKVLADLAFDERMITLQHIWENNPDVEPYIQEGIDKLRMETIEKANLPKGYLTWDEKQLINGRLELVRSDWEDYTLEELASLVK